MAGGEKLRRGSTVCLPTFSLPTCRPDGAAVKAGTAGILVAGRLFRYYKAPEGRHCLHTRLIFIFIPCCPPIRGQSACRISRFSPLSQYFGLPIGVTFNFPVVHFEVISYPFCFRNFKTDLIFKGSPTIGERMILPIFTT